MPSAPLSNKITVITYQIPLLTKTGEILSLVLPLPRISLELRSLQLKFTLIVTKNNKSLSVVKRNPKESTLVRRICLRPKFVLHQIGEPHTDSLNHKP